MKKGSVKTLLFDSVPIENYIFSLLHAEIGVGNKVLDSYFKWINERIEHIDDEELELSNDLIDLKVELKHHVKELEQWIKSYSFTLATLWITRTGIIKDIDERDDNNKLKRSLKERKELVEHKQCLATKIDNLTKDKKQLACLIQSTNQLIESKKKEIKDYRLLHNKTSKSIANILEAKLVEVGIDRARYHGGDLEGTSIIRLFQNANKIFNQFSMKIKNIITNEEQKKEVEDYTMRFIEICTLFDSLFSLSRTSTGK